MPEFHLYLPQMRLSFDRLVARAQLAESLGFDGMAFMDHLAPPLARHQPMHEAVVTAAWVAAHTVRMTLGHLVLCDAFRHPALLARQIASLDHASGGRVELGIGSGSRPDELMAFGVGSPSARERIARLGETLAVLRDLWGGEPMTFKGRHHALEDAQQQPTPTRRIPITIGGVGRRTLELVARYADWWNVPTRDVERIDELRPYAGDARVSALVMVGLVLDERGRAQTIQTACRRFSAIAGSGLLLGDAAEITARLARLGECGVERFYVWFTDFASPGELEGFAAIMDRLRADGTIPIRAKSR